MYSHSTVVSYTETTDRVAMHLTSAQGKFLRIVLELCFSCVSEFCSRVLLESFARELRLGVVLESCA